MKINSKYQNVTASINKRNGKWILMIRDTTGDSPRQISRTTKEGNWHKAQTVALSILDNLYADPDIIPVQSSQTGRSILTVTDMVESYFNGKYMNKQILNHPPEKIKKHVSAMNARIRNLSEFFNNTPVRRLSKFHINNYIEHRRKMVTDGTVRVELNALFAAVNSELSNGDRYNVVQNCKDYGPLQSKEQGRRKDVLDYEQCNAIHEKVEEYDRKHHTNFALFIECLLFTGIRWGTMARLTFDKINFKKRILTFERDDLKSTTQEFHHVPVEKELMTKLYRLKQKNDNADKPRKYVWASKARPDKMLSRTTFYNVWYGAQEALGDDFKKHDEKKGKDVYKFRPHDLKRTFIADSYDLGHDRAEIKARTGNVSDPVYDGYYTDRQSRKHAEERRQKRKELYEAQNHSEQQIVDLAAEVEAGIWDMDTLDKLEIIVKKKKAEQEGLKITDEDVDI